ncbi:MAG: hypothetical protein GY720_01695 [bacterium]|nr:hypothetical protein [bacterium]
MALTTLGAWAVMKQTTTKGFSYHATFPRSFEATGAGNASGFTIVTTTLASYASGNDDFVGMAVRVLKCANGPSTENGAPLIRRIKKYTHASQTLTIEALPFQTADADSFELLEVPTGYFAEDSGGSAVNIVDDDRTEANDYFVGSAEQGGQYVWCQQGTNVATTANALCLDFDAASDTLSCATLGANTAVGDLYQPMTYPESADGPLTLGQPRLDRGSIIGQRGQLRGVAGLREASGQKTLMFAGPGTSRIGSASAWDIFLGSVLTPQAASADWVLSDGTTTSLIQVKSGTPVVDSPYVAENGDAFVASTTGATVVPYPTMRTAGAVDTNAYGLRKYTGADVAAYALAHYQWHGKEVQDLIVGSLPTITFEAARGDWLKMLLNFTGADGYRVHLDETGTAISRPINPKTPTVTPQMLGNGRLVLDTTEFEARSMTLDLGIDIQEQTNLAAPNATDGVTIRDIKPTFTADVFLDSDSEVTYHKFIDGQPMRLLMQMNEAPGEPGVFVFFAVEVEYTGFEIGEDAGAVTAQLQGRVTVDTTNTTLSQWLIGIG